MMSFEFRKYVESHAYAGNDPYDSLNSPILSRFSKCRFLGVALTQLLKKSPVNMRPLLLIPKGVNPKALALFIKGYVRKGELKRAESLASRMVKLKSDRPYFCWGYNFPWAARAFVVPRWEPNLVTSVFVADALLDLYEATGKKSYLNQALGVKDFILAEMVLEESEDTAFLRYVPGKPAKVHNASLFGAMILARLFELTNEKRLKELARKVVEYSVRAQRKDGSWPYGELAHHQWVDNFHTGYNLVAINRYMRYANDMRYVKNLNLGLKYHLKHHFEGPHMVPKYYDNKKYPIDIHNYAQGIVTMMEFGLEGKAKILAAQAIKTMQDPSGFFYFQKHPLYTIKIPYMRWSQAWMFYALSLLGDEL